MKNCSSKKCTQSNPQPLENFNKNKTTKDGLQAFCKSCRHDCNILNREKLRVKNAKWQRNNPEKVKERNDRWVSKNKDKVNAKHRRWRNKNPEKMTAAKRKWENNNPDKVKAQRARTYRKNKEKSLAQSAKWQRNNPEKVKERNAKWAKNNKGKTTAILAKRRAQKLNATPSWLTKKQKAQIQEFYDLAKELQWLSEEPLHVDHIIPLRGKNISGLHVPWNLQILTRRMNISKGNRVLEK